MNSLFSFYLLPWLLCLIPFFIFSTAIGIVQLMQECFLTHLNKEVHRERKSTDYCCSSGLPFPWGHYSPKAVDELCWGHTTLTPICARACVCPSNRTAIQQTLTHYKASTMSTNIQNSFNFSSCMHKKPLIPLILVKWIQITYIIAFHSHNSLQYSKVLL